MRCRLVLAAAALVGATFWANMAQAGGCANCGPTPQSYGLPSAQAYPAPQGPIAPECYPVACETGGCHGGGGHGCLSGLKHKMGGMGHGLKCKLGGMGHGLKCKVGGLKHKIGGLGCFSKHHEEPVCYTGCEVPYAYPSAQGPSPQGYPAPQGPIAAPQGIAAPAGQGF